MAGELKSLANQTGKATEDISNQVMSVQAATAQAVGAIRAVVGTIGRISEIARNVGQAATGTSEVTRHMSALNGAPPQAGSAAGGMLASTRSLADEARGLQNKVEGLLNSIRM